MSKQSEAKEYQGYVDKVIPMVCGNCAHYQSKITEIDNGWFGKYTNEREKRCGLGGFAVSKMGGCRLHKDA